MIVNYPGEGLSEDVPDLPAFDAVLTDCRWEAAAGAALAVARLDRAPQDHALGLAYSSAAGTMQAHVEGSPALPFQIANAARSAVMASDLAKAGFTAPRDVIEGPFGYLALFEDGDISRYTADIGKHWLLSQVSIKPFPSGRASHGALAAPVAVARALNANCRRAPSPALGGRRGARTTRVTTTDWT